MSPHPHPKRQSRELALQSLFQAEFTTPVATRDFLELFEGSVPKDVVDYAEELINAFRANKAEIDSQIQSASRHWKVERMAIVDRNILRLAITEMKHVSAPVKPSIAINEAIDIAKKFGSTDSGGFVNGILDQIRKENGWE